MGSTAEDVAAVADEEACMYAMQPPSSSIRPMKLMKALELGLLKVPQPDPSHMEMELMLNNALELGALLEVLQAEPSGMELLPEEVVARLPDEVVARLPVAPTNPGAADMFDCMLRLLASFGVVRCQMEDKDGKYERRYSAAAPVERQGAAPAPGGSCMPAACVRDLESACLVELRVTTSAAGTGAAVAAWARPWIDLLKKACPLAMTYAYDSDAESVFTSRDAGEDGICDITTSDPETGSNQPTRDNGSSEEVGSTAGSDPLHVSLIVAVLGGVTAVMGLVAAVLGVWKSCFT